MIRPNNAAKKILSQIKYAAIATVNEAGQPWNSPIAVFRFDNDYTLYWASWHNNQHSQNIRANGKAFVAIYDSTPADEKPAWGVYLQGGASELTDEQEAMRAALVFKNDPFNPSDGLQYLGGYPRRIYKFTPEKIWMNAEGTINGNFIDTRKEATA